MNRINTSATRLFEVWCEVTPLKQHPDRPGPTATVTRSFPETFQDEKVLNAIGDFAFPCEFERNQVQVYSFVITDMSSQWRFGFCRHETKSDTATVIVTHLPWHDQFIKYINRLAEVKNNSPMEFQRFLSETYANGVPEPGQTVHIFPNHERFSFEFKMPWSHELPSIPENHNLSVYYNFVEPEMMIDVFCAMLNERRIIFTSQRLEVLSSCVLAAGDLIYPMTWQHIYIPVLPMKLKEYVNAPMPYLIGVAKPVLQAIRPDELADVVLLDCDNKRFESQFDDKKSLPRDVLEGLRKNLNNPMRLRGEGVSRTFLRAIVQLIGGYRDGFKYGDPITFDDSQFLEARSPRLRPFLKSILELQIFRQFVDDRLKSMKVGYSDEFEKEIRLHYEKVSKKKFKIIQNIKEKAKEGGRGMKTVYKGIKTRFKEAKGSSSNNFRNSITTDSETRASPPPSESFDELDDTASSDGNLEEGRNISLTPSPMHSRSSSGMNILQELEREGLFSRPEVDRSLKPKQSIIPLTLTTNTAFSSNNNSILSNNNNNNGEKPFVIRPMVPPRPRHLLTTFSAPKSESEGSNASVTLPDKSYDPFVKVLKGGPIDEAVEEKVPTQAPPLPPSVPPRRSHLQQQARQDFFNNSYEHWQIKPASSSAKEGRVNGGEKVTKNPSIDLIKLDDSVELDDFDPLNDPKLNPVSSPSTSSRSEASSSISMIPSSIVGFSNPVYTFGNEPPASSASLNLHASERSESLELLTKYGLDQYTLLANGQVSAGVGALSSVNNNPVNSKKWTTFE